MEVTLVIKLAQGCPYCHQTLILVQAVVSLPFGQYQIILHICVNNLQSCYIKEE